MCLICEDERIVNGSKVMAHWRGHKYIDDITTPWKTLLEPATVVCRYGYKKEYRGNIVCDDWGRQYGEVEYWEYPDIVDLVFDCEPSHISRGHFTTSVKYIELSNG